MTKPNIREVIAATAAWYRIPAEKILGRETYRQYAYPRQVAMFLARQMTGRSLMEIGRRFNRDHTTCLHAIRKVPERAADDDLLRAILAIAATATTLARAREASDWDMAAEMHIAALKAPKPRSRAANQDPPLPPAWPRRIMIVPRYVAGVQKAATTDSGLQEVPNHL